jgi:predicted MPP superfamily phosphohydrolase
MLMATGTRRFRALFISDVHLGAKGCQAERLLDFLRDHDADVIYLVGDIVDGWQLKSGWYWPQAHNDVVQKLLRQARKGARIVYLPGNHDTNSCATITARISAASRCRTRRCTRAPTAAAIWSSTAIISTSWSPRRVGSRSWARRIRLRRPQRLDRRPDSCSAARIDISRGLRFLAGANNLLNPRLLAAWRMVR